jgi:hypothetical protein
MKGINRIPPAEVATPRRAGTIFVSTSIHKGPATVTSFASPAPRSKNPGETPGLYGVIYPFLAGF